MSLRAWLVSLIGSARVTPADSDIVGLARPGATPLGHSLATMTFAQLRSAVGGGSDQGAVPLPPSPADGTATLATAQAAALAAGKRELRVEAGRTYNVTDSTALLGDALIVGDNARFSGADYIQPIPLTAPTRLAAAHCIPAVHLRRARLAAAVPRAVRVVFVGDSIFAGGNILTQVEGQPAQIARRFRRCNPGVAFEFYTRAIPGATWDRLINSGPVNQYTNAGLWTQEAGTQTWMQVITALQPDVVICCFGMNALSASATSRLAMEGLDMLEAITPRPDIILATNYLPTTRSEADTPLASFLIGRVQAGGITRALAWMRGHALLDIQRQQMIAQFGIDPRECWMERTGENLARTLPTASAVAVADHAVRLQWTGNIWAGGDTGRGLAIQFSADPGALLLLERDAATGNIAITGTVTGRTWLARTFTSAPASTTGAILEIWLKDGFLHVQIPISGSTPGSDIFRDFVPQLGGPFTLTLLHRDLSSAVSVTGFAVSLVTVFAGRYARVRNYVTDAELHGVDVINGPIGGGNFNHPTHLAHAAISGVVVETADFCVLT